MRACFRSALMALLALCAAAGAAVPARAQTEAYPNRLVRIVVPLAAGSVTDVLARLVADKLGEVWKQTIIVENRPGVPGITSVAKSAPDGYTLLVNSNGHTIAGAVNKDLPFDPAKDFVGVTQLVSAPQTLIVPADLPAKTVAEFIALARQKPGQMNFGSLGVASAAFLGAQIFRHEAKIDIVHVPYKGSPEAITSVIRGDTQLYYLSVNLAVELHKAGKVRVMAVSTPQRSAALPDVPTVAESGLPNYSFDSWFGMMAPAGTPPAVVAKIQSDIAAVLHAPETAARLTTLGLVIVGSKPDVFDALIKSDTVHNTEILRQAGVTPN
ncbi:Bug family tripartite tricarboxylate transporter substrate binding protein [Rhodoplanes sp. Z2-YC6860]|uniref:Bug family tripartite tricarboxylate transporter substrate binding protein n=1 Tax=Rhodoplanes sp. Z2-YC6860 TaxID=674703 RepID=UPI00078ECF37|nr:tripartite tricarboxylate transporter substrate binding protein [Rhodoplanes sp. Z2-YC6860]AMN39623.1 extra-cytoplasmic solute receptor protein [Rhodoplanes sp. Z2-YC6860]